MNSAQVVFSVDDLKKIALANQTKRYAEQRRLADGQAAKDNEDCDQLIYQFNRACRETLSEDEVTMKIPTKFYDTVPLRCLRTAVEEKGFKGFKNAGWYVVHFEGVFSRKAQ